MDFEEAFQHADRAVRAIREGEGLRDIDRIVLEGAWHRQKYQAIAAAAGYSEGYLSRDIGPSLWSLLSEALGTRVSKTNFRNAISTWAQQHPTSPPPAPDAPRPLDAPQIIAADAWRIDISGFQGRREELQQLVHWIQHTPGRLLGLSGPPGVGKTWLAAKLAEQLQTVFPQQIYCDLSDRPYPEALTQELLHRLGAASDNGSGPVAQSTALVELLTQQPCLLILDGAEVFCQPGQLAGSYAPAFEGYGALLHTLATRGHRSCVLWIGRQIAEFPFSVAGARAHVVSGLPATVLPDLPDWPANLQATPADWQALYQACGGIPGLLPSLVSQLSVLGGSLSHCLSAQNRAIALDSYLEAWLAPLAAAEWAVLHWLAISHRPLSLEALQQRHPKDSLAVIASLGRRGLCQRVTNSPPQWCLALPQGLSDYLCRQLIAHFQTRDEGHWLQQLHGYALLHTQASEAIQQWQRQHLLQPIAATIAQHFATESEQRSLVARLLSASRDLSREQPGYSAGNLINLAQIWQISLVGIDCQDLMLWEADLQSDLFQGMTFTGTDLSTTILAKPLGQGPVADIRPDGAQLAIGDQDGRLMLWTLPEGRLQRMLALNTASTIQAIAFSPDSQSLAEGRQDGRVRLWELQSLYEPELLSAQPSAPICTLAYSPDGQLLAGGDGQGTLHIWRLASGECWHQIAAHQGAITAIAFSPCQQFMATCSQDGTAIEWQLATGQAVHRFQQQTTAWIQTVGYLTSPDAAPLAGNGAVVLGQDDGGQGREAIWIWELSTGDPYRILPERGEGILGLCLSPDGQYVAASTLDRHLSLWQVTTRERRHHLSVPDAIAHTLTFTPDSAGVITGSDFQVQLWQVATGECWRRWRGDRQPATALTLTGSGPDLLSAHPNGTLRRWQCLAGHPRWLPTQRVNLGSATTVRQIAAGPAGQIWALGDENGTVALWQTATQTWLDLPIRLPAAITALRLSADDAWLAAGDESGTVALWHLTSGRPCWQQSAHGDRVAALAFTPGKQPWALLSSSRDRVIRGWNQQGDLTLELTGHQRRIHALWPTPDGVGLISGSHDGTVRCWDLTTQTCTHTWQHGSHWIYDVAMDSAQTPLAIISDTTTLEVWNIQANTLKHRLDPHGDALWHVSFCANGQYLLSASQDSEIAIWSLANRDRYAQLRVDRPYEAMQIGGCTGLSDVERDMMYALGAVDY